MVLPDAHKNATRVIISLMKDENNVCELITGRKSIYIYIEIIITFMKYKQTRAYAFC